MSIVKDIENELMILNQKYIDESKDGYDFWNSHIKHVVREAKILAKNYNADLEIVELGALLHDIALVAKIGTKDSHHLNGVLMAKELLEKYGYSKEKTNRVMNCVLNHRSSKNTETIEEMCVADADIIAHFYNIPSSFVLGVKKFNFKKAEEFIEWFKKDYEDLSEQTKVVFKDKYNNIMNVLFNDYWENV